MNLWGMMAVTVGIVKMTCNKPYCVFTKCEISSHNAPIVCPSCMRLILDSTGKVSILTSGGYDPLHGGHVSCIQDSKVKASNLMSHEQTMKISAVIVVVNGDSFLKKKKGRALMPLRARCQVVSAIRGVDYVVPLVTTDPADMTVCEALEIIKPYFFCKGGDRNLSNIPEVDVCKRVGIKVITGCGDDKYWSSSDFTNNYRNFVLDEDLKGRLEANKKLIQDWHDK